MVLRRGLKPEFGGQDSGPDPSELVAAALAACELLTGVAWASKKARQGIAKRGSGGHLGVRGKTERVSNIKVVIQNVADQLGDKTAAFKAIAKGCTVSKTLKIPPELELEVE